MQLRPTNRFPAIPSAVDPHSRGAGRRPARRVKTALTPVRTLVGRAVVCSARPGRRRAGWLPPPPPTDRDPPTEPGHPGAGAPPPEAQ